MENANSLNIYLVPNQACDSVILRGKTSRPAAGKGQLPVYRYQKLKMQFRMFYIKIFLRQVLTSSW